jgi:kumamolisin
MTTRTELPGSRHSAPHGMQPLGRVPDDEPITVSVYLKSRSGDPLLQAGSAPGFQSRAALRTLREDDHAEDVAAVRAFAEEHGLDVRHADPARRLVQITGKAANIEKAFGTELNHYEQNGYICRGRGGALHLPQEIVDRVDAVLGLDTSPIATPKIVPHRGATPPEGFLPSEIAALYGFGDLDAAGQCIAVIELGGGYTAADNDAAFAAMRLQVPEIVAVPVDGSANNPGDGSGANGEVALDIQVAGGVARGAKIAVYFAPNTSQGFVDAISQAVHDDTHKPSVISISWGSAEGNWSGQALTAMNAALKDAAALGVTVTAASGDALATDGEADGQPHVDYPSSDPYVLGCGGTRIAAAEGTLTSEVVWKSNGGGTGGGVSAVFARPDYQASVDVPKPISAKGGRGVPDVAGDADPDSGYRIVTGGRTAVIGGTSAVAPLWAGIVAGLNAARGKPLGFIHERLYANSNTFRDVIDGDNRSGAIGYVAAPGWDPCTGLGSPADLLREALAKAA